jgi:superfamily II DNA or RNA helicase
MITLRDYQQKGINDIRASFAKGNRRVLYQLSTGGGKTCVFSHIASSTLARGKSVLIISHRIELLMQSGGTLEQYNIKPFYITAATKTPPKWGKCSVAMVNTLKNRLKPDAQNYKEWTDWLAGIDLLIIDECHRSEFAWLNTLMSPKSFKLGVTASPRRSGKMPQLADEYDDLILGPDTQELINMGYLVIDNYYGVNSIDLSGVGRDSEGEYNSTQLFEKFNKVELYEGLIDNYLKIASDTITICFCVNIQHCVNTCLEFQSRGIRAKFLSSTPSRPQITKGTTRTW